MSRAEELLNSLNETVVEHKHPVPDADTYFIIDPYTRQIENTNYQKTVLMRGDHNSERFTFELPRYVDGHDMSLCNRVIAHFDNVGATIEDINSDLAYLEDLHINPDKPDTVIASWLIRREATQIVGILSFSLQYQCVEDDGDVSYEWNTDSYDDIEIRKSKNNGEAAVVQYTNVLEEWRSKLFGASDSVIANISAEGANQITAVQNESLTQQEAIERKGSDTLASIPGDYTEVYNMASEAVRTKADSIVNEIEGNTITIKDASNDHVRGLRLFGKTTISDNGVPVPRPDFPQELVSVENPIVTIQSDGQSAEQILETSYTLLGIPVASDGDYTDSNGQQWICDELDFERDVHIQRIGTYAVTGNEYMNASAANWQKTGMFSTYMNMLTPDTKYASDDVGLFHCSMSERCQSNTWEWTQHSGLNNIAVRKSIVYLSLDNSVTGILAEDDDENKLAKFKAYLAEQYAAGTPIEVHYILATPIEVSITEEDYEAFKTLKTNHPNTTVINDSHVWMKVKYNVDTKLYIHNTLEDEFNHAVEEVLNDTY